MNVLVTGGAGFIGSHIVDKLVDLGARVTIIDNLVSGRKENINPEAVWHNIDIRSKELHAVMAAEAYDYVIHHAAQTMVPVSLENPYYDADVNIQGTINLLEACRKYKVKRIIFASSAAVYGNCPELPLTEAVLPRPESFYGLSKLTVEQYLVLYQQIFALDYVILRYANVYGERQGDAGEGGVVSIFTRKIANHDSLTIYGDGEQTRDFIYVGDVAEANIKALTTKFANTVYNISTATETTVNELTRILAAAAQTPIDIKYTDSRQGDIYRSYLANEKAIQCLGWKPNTDLAHGLTKTFQSLL